jgi:hypothetical protein
MTARRQILLARSDSVICDALCIAEHKSSIEISQPGFVNPSSESEALRTASPTANDAMSVPPAVVESSQARNHQSKSIVPATTDD